MAESDNWIKKGMEIEEREKRYAEYWAVSCASLMQRGEFKIPVELLEAYRATGALRFLPE